MNTGTEPFVHTDGAFAVLYNSGPQPPGRRPAAVRGSIGVPTLFSFYFLSNSERSFITIYLDFLREICPCLTLDTCPFQSLPSVQWFRHSVNV